MVAKAPAAIPKQKVIGFLCVNMGQNPFLAVSETYLPSKSNCSISTPFTL
jgi:hypothetical protein